MPSFGPVDDARVGLGASVPAGCRDTGCSGDDRDAEMHVFVELARGGRTAIVRDDRGRSLELPVKLWSEVPARIEIALAKVNGTSGDPEAPPFGAGPGRVGPGRHRANWTAHELSELAKAYRAGTSIAALALTHQRTTGAVEGQLVRLGLIRDRHRQYSISHRKDWPDQRSRDED